MPRRVWSGTAWQAAGRLVGSGCTALALVLLARALDAAAFGRLTFYLALFALLEAWTDFGTSTAIVQASARDAALLPRWLAAGRRLRLASAALGALAVAALAFGFREPGAAWIALAGLHPLSRVPELSAVVYQSAMAWRVPVRARALGALARLALVALLLALGARGAAPFVLAHAAGLSAGNLWLARAARARLAREAEVAAPAHPGAAGAARAALAALARAAWPLGLTAVVQQAYFYADNLFVRALCGDEELGRYNAAVRVTSLLLLAGTLASATALPWLARAWRDGRLGEATTRLGAPLFAAAGLALGALLPWSAALLALLFGPGFAEAAPSLRWLLGAALAVHAGAVLLTALVAAGDGRAVLATALGGLALNLAANAWLVPRQGAAGAALATCATEAWIALAALLFLRRRGVGLGPRPLAWLGGPAAFALAWLASHALARWLGAIPAA